MISSTSPRRKKRLRHMGEINLANLIDVMLSVLIIFMITAPLMTQGVQVDLPKADAKNVEVNEYVEVSITERNEVYVGQERVNLIDFPKRFRSAWAGRQEIPVFVNADKRVPYGLVLRVISEVQNAGVVKLGFLSAPIEKKRR